MRLKKISYTFLLIIVSIFFIITANHNVIAHSNLPKINDSESQLIQFEDFIAQQDFDAVEIKTIPVRYNIYMLMANGGNIGVSVGEDGTLLIDSQYAPLTEKIKQSISSINQKQIRYLINTHYHLDHTGGNENMANLGAVIIAHKNVPKQMSIAHSYPVMGMETPASSESALPVMTFNDSFDLDFNKSEIHAFHIPLAHTDGDVVIQFKEQNVIHTGDLFFNGFYPFIDTQVGGSVDGMVKAIDQILSLCNDDTIIIPGHGELSNRQELINFQKMLKTVDQRVKNAVANKMSLDDLIKANLLADLDETWGKGFLNSEQFLTIAYQGLQKK